MIKKLLKKSERGQAIVLIAFALIGLIALVGLMVDGGMLFIEYARLKRGIDAAAISAALSYREGAPLPTLEKTAKEFLRLNQSDVSAIIIEKCEPGYYDINGDLITPPPVHLPPPDPALCTPKPRKLVRVTASRHVEFGFLRIIGIRETDITASAIGEAAPLDLVIVIDTSSSMSNETGDPLIKTDDNPAGCNPTNSCEPMRSVKQTAEDFVNKAAYFPYDRVAIVASTGQNAGSAMRTPYVVLSLSSDHTAVIDAIRGLNVFQPRDCTGPNPNPAFAGACIPTPYTGNLKCDYCQATNDYSSIGSSDIGTSLWQAGDVLMKKPSKREEAVWVVVLIAGGPVNASMADGSFWNQPSNPLQFGYCPESERYYADPRSPNTPPFCRDNEWPSKLGPVGPDTRHCYDPMPAVDIWQPPFTHYCKKVAGTVTNNALYDADDFARDWADKLAGPPKENGEGGYGVTIFTIGLATGGVDYIHHAPDGDPLDGEELLQYIATEAGDNWNYANYKAKHGDYYFSPDPAGLTTIFLEIANKVATRISQ